MVKRFEFSVAGCMGDSEYGCAARMDDELDGAYILATDYAALEAERDELKRRCQNLVEAMRHHGYSAESLALIAEGRDNG